MKIKYNLNNTKTINALKQLLVFISCSCASSHTNLLVVAALSIFSQKHAKGILD